MRGKLLVPALVALLAFVPAAAEAAKTPAAKAKPAKAKPANPPESFGAGPLVRTIEVSYRAHDGKARSAWVVLPAWYGRLVHPPIPLVISPHGRGVSARANAALWGSLPARGAFAVISPEGAGRVLSRYSWGSLGQVDDLARMPEIARRTVPYLHVDSRKIYAFGGSMGGQETLLLLARHPKLLAGAAAFDSVADFARQYESFPQIPCNKACRKVYHGPVGLTLQSLARQETGGTPKTRPLAYQVRSPITYVRRIAASCVPLQLWWSLSDRIVVDQDQQSGTLFRQVMRLNPRAPVEAYVGYWVHSHEMRARTKLPVALAAFGLLRSHSRVLLRGMEVVPQPEEAPGCGGRPLPQRVETEPPPTVVKKRPVR